MRGLRSRLGKSRGQTKDRTSGVAGHAAVAATGLPPPPRSGAQGRRQRLMTRRAAAEIPPDSQPGPQTPRRTRTLKRSLRRHAQLARRPPAPLLSGLLGAHAQCCQSPQIRAQRACACVRPGSAEVPAQAQTGIACRPPPLPHSKKGFKGAPSNSNLPPRRATSATEGLPPQGCAHTANAVAMLRHSIVRLLENASVHSAQSPGNRHNLNCSVTIPLAL